MKVVYITLVIGLMVMMTGAAYAQMDQSQAPADQSQAQMNQAQPQASTGTTCPAPAQAQAPTTFKATVQRGPVVMAGAPASADVFVNGRLAMRIAAPAGGMSTMQRAQIIADRLNAAFAAGESWNDMRVSQVGDNWTVNLGDRVIATADANSACVFGTTPGKLASKWATGTVVAMGGQPSAIAANLMPVPSMVAGSQQQTCPPAVISWATTPTKSVPLLSAQTGGQLGTVTVAGPQSQLNMVNSVVVYQSSAADGAQVWTFVPITGTTTTDNLTRVNGIGLTGVPASMVPTTAAVSTGTDMMSAISKSSSGWNSMINSNLSTTNLQITGASTKVVPLYSSGSRQVIGAAQVVGNASDVNNTQAVIAIVNGDNVSFTATSASCTPLAGTPPSLNHVVVSSIILMPTSGAVPTTPGTSGAGMAAPESTTPGAAAPETTTPPATTTPGTETPAPSAPESGTPTTP